MISIKRALISVSDKTGIVEFARFLSENGAEILSTGGTLKTLRDAGLATGAIEDYTGFPEMMDGRLKTLHPKIHGGLLALRDNKDHVRSMTEHGISGIDLVVVNLYPFAATIARTGATFDEAVENIDIGGPAMLRSAAKNYRFTAAVCDPADYSAVMDAVRAGGVTQELSLRLSRTVFNHTAAYDAMIAGYLNKNAGIKFPENLTLTYRKTQGLRYGENPHQEAAYYRPAVDLEKERITGIPGTRQLQGKELSFNNLLDFSSALFAALSLPGPGAVIVKHLNPCGASANAGKLADAFLLARNCDPVSAFGGVIAVSDELDESTASLIAENFAEGVIAPSFSAGALKVLADKKNLRLIEYHNAAAFLEGGMEIRQILGGVLYQDFDSAYAPADSWKTVTETVPDSDTMQALDFAWRLVKHVKSNAIVFCSQNASLGIGAGQMSRIDSVDIAVMKAQKNGLDLKNSVVASDAFFPFRDGLDSLARAGAKAVIQPGGSVRDQEVIDAANEHKIAMVFTGMRHFRH